MFTAINETIFIANLITICRLKPVIERSESMGKKKRFSEHVRPYGSSKKYRVEKYRLMR